MVRHSLLQYTNSVARNWTILRFGSFSMGFDGVFRLISEYGIRVVAAVAFAIFIVAGCDLAYAGPRLSTAEKGLVRLEARSLSAPTDGSLAATASITIDLPTSYLEARLQMHSPAGRLIYQKTEVRSELPTGTVSIGFERELRDLGLAPGIYPIELRVRSDSTTTREWIIRDRLLVHKPNPAATPLVLIARINGAPTSDAEGRFLFDPAQVSRARRDVEFLARLVNNRPELRVSLAIPPMLLDEWYRIAQGYEILREEQVVSVPATDPSSRSYAEALSLLQRAIGTGRLELLELPYSSPDIGGLQATGRLGDLKHHFSLGRSVYAATLEATPVAGAVMPSDLLPAEGIAALKESQMRFSVLGPESLISAESTPPSGVYESEGMRVLLTEPAITTHLAAGDIAAAIDSIFARAISDEPTTPVTVTVDLGGGQPVDTQELEDFIETALGAPWVSFSPADEAANHAPALTVALVDEVAMTAGVRPGYWDAVEEARRYSAALMSITPTGHPLSAASTRASLIAQSQMWAGSDGRWAAIDRGLAFADAAVRHSRTLFDAITISAPSDLTLSSAVGEVPLTVVNNSETELELQVRTIAEGLATNSPVRTLQVRPQENFLTVPVDLQSSISGRLGVEIWADDILIAEGNTTVRASYLDRLAIIGGVTLVLVALLLFIYRRVRRSQLTDTITTEQSTHLER